MSTKEVNNLSGIIIDRGNLNYNLSMISNKEVRDHVVDVINSLFDAKYESKSTDYRI